MILPFIKFENVTIEIPIFNSEYFSLRKSVVSSNKKTIFINALDNINLEINSGERVGLYGPNGSGKTTLLRAIAGGYPPMRGQLNKFGFINNLIETGIGIDFESTGIDNIKLRLLLIGYPEQLMDAKQSEIINFSELGDAIYNPVRTYSSGMLMRLTFSIATSIKADVILLDEWLSVGDAEFQKKAAARMEEITTEASILVIASHNYEMLERLCSKIVFLENGKIKEIKEIEEI